MELPKHIAIIMDGNGRWARRRFLPRIAGHRAGVEATRRIIRLCAEKGIAHLTLYAFSTENWQRPQTEVSALMRLFLQSLQKELNELRENNIQLHFIGERSAFSDDLQTEMQKAETLTQQNSGMRLIIAVNYGGRWDILQAVRKIIKDNVQDVSENSFSSYLSTACWPDPDLFIRTSGEQRISNYLNWQLSYTELFFTDTLWPDFGEKDFLKALQVYNSRQRRYGCTAEQLKTDKHA